MESVPPDLPGRPGYLAWLPAFLFRTDPVRARYVVRAFLLCVVPSFFLSGLVQLLLPDARRPDFSVFHGPLGPAFAMFLLIVVSPVIETLMLVPIVIGLQRLAGAGAAVVGSALIWALLHASQAPAWGLIVWWPFLIMAIALLTWRERGLGQAMLIVIAIHALQNSLAGAVLLIAGA